MTNNKVLFYHLMEDVIDGKLEYSLIRVIDWEGQEYFEGKWQSYPGAMSYYPDPTPGDFIDEEKAKEIMDLIDEQEENDMTSENKIH